MSFIHKNLPQHFKDHFPLNRVIFNHWFVTYTHIYSRYSHEYIIMILIILYIQIKAHLQLCLSADTSLSFFQSAFSPYKNLAKNFGSTATKDNTGQSSTKRAYTPFIPSSHEFAHFQPLLLRYMHMNIPPSPF